LLPTGYEPFATTPIRINYVYEENRLLKVEIEKRLKLTSELKTDERSLKRRSDGDTNGSAATPRRQLPCMGEGDEAPHERSRIV
jgi:hypothetical protein